MHQPRKLSHSGWRSDPRGWSTAPKSNRYLIRSPCDRLRVLPSSHNYCISIMLDSSVGHILNIFTNAIFLTARISPFGSPSTCPIKSSSLTSIRILQSSRTTFYHPSSLTFSIFGTIGTKEKQPAGLQHRLVRSGPACWREPLRSYSTARRPPPAAIDSPPG